MLIQGVFRGREILVETLYTFEDSCKVKGFCVLHKLTAASSFSRGKKYIYVSVLNSKTRYQLLLLLTVTVKLLGIAAAAASAAASHPAWQHSAAHANPG